MRKDKNSGDASASRLKEIICVLRRHGVARMTPAKLRRILEDLGPTFVKAGQILSMRPDMVPMEYCDELMLLRTDAKPMEFGEVERVLEEEYGKDWRSVFSHIDREPSGSASIAQVHKAVLADGRRVAVKVQRPGIYQKMEQDVRLFHKLSGMIKLMTGTKRVVDLDAVMDEMWAAARRELDFLTEAEYIRQFAQANEGVKYIAFPGVERELTTKKVLVMEDVSGIRIDDTEKLKAAGYDPKEICLKLAENFAKQVLDDGLFHADPHPGNIHIRDGKIVWIDLGMTGRLSGRDRRLLASAMEAVAEGDIYSLKNIVLEIGVYTGKIDHARLYSDIEEMLARYGSLELGRIDIGQVMRDFLSVADLNGISVPSNIAMLGRGLVTLEGVLSRIDPEINFLQIVAKRMAQSAWKDIDLQSELISGAKHLYDFGRHALRLPGQLSGVLKAASRGQLKITVENSQTERSFYRIRKVWDRAMLAFICGSLFVGSSLLCLSGLPVCFAGVPLISFIGFCAALLIFLFLLFGMADRR